METLQTTVETAPRSKARPHLDYAAARGQGSPVPGETASPQSFLQHSPSLPASGMTESSDASLEEPDLNDPPQKQYVGVRVKRPVRELLRKIRLSKGIESNDKEMSLETSAKKTSRTAKKKRAYSENRHKQNRHRVLKSVEELDILVEVLQEDLNASQPKLGLQVSMPCGQASTPESWTERVGNPPPEDNWEPIPFQPCSPGALWHPFGGGTMEGCPNATNAFRNSCEEESRWQEQSPAEHPRECAQVSAKDSPPGNHILIDEGRAQKPSAGPFSKQDVPTISLFQFQLQQEETRLRNISVEKLLEPDRHGSRLLHGAVAQERRVLAYALAWRMARLNKIDEKDAAKQTALHIAARKNHHLIASDLIALGANVNARDILGKTPLHLCAEKGNLAVLEVLQNCQQKGKQVKVDATDNRGLTPLQGGALAHAALVKDLENPGLPLETKQVLTLRKDRILRGTRCLVEMGADSRLQGTMSSDQTSHYFARMQEDKELMNVFQIYRPKWAQESNSLRSRDALRHLQVERIDSPEVLFSKLLEQFLGPSAM